jgi:hypothetical protein
MLTVPEKYVQRKTMLDAGFEQVACRKCSETAWWLWLGDGYGGGYQAVFVCKNCGWIPPHCLLEFTIQPARAPDP